MSESDGRRIAFAGAGRLGASIAQAAASAGYNVVALSSRRPSHREFLRTRLPEAKVVGTASEAAVLADLVFITTSDTAIEPVCRSIRWNPGMAAVHCSGAVPLDALDHAACAGAPVGGLHPLQTFPGPDSFDRLSGVSFAIESSDHALLHWLSAFARDIGGDPFPITSRDRAAYHASAVMAGSLTAGLAGIAAELWRQFGVPRDEALRRLAPLSASVAAGVAMRGLPAAMTGPYVRGETETVSQHINAMKAQPAETAHAYAALALAQLHIAAGHPGLSPEALQEIEALLRAALDDSGRRLREG